MLGRTCSTDKSGHNLYSDVIHWTDRSDDGQMESDQSNDIDRTCSDDVGHIEPILLFMTSSIINLKCIHYGLGLHFKPQPTVMVGFLVKYRKYSADCHYYRLHYF